MSVGGPQKPISEHESIFDQRRIPVQRSEHDILQDIADSLVHIRAGIEHINARVSAGESRSSASVKTSTRGVDLEVKSYADDLLVTAVDEAIAQYARGMLELEVLRANGWAATLEAIEEKREGATNG